MSRKLSEEFAEARSRRVVLDGADVWSMLQFDVATSSVVQVRRLRSSGTRPQGLRLQAVGGDLVANGQRAKAIVLWDDNSPEAVVVECVVRKGKSAKVKVWNVWRDDDGGEHAWVGNCGMTLDADGCAYDVACSDGWGEPTFDDLLVRLHAPQWRIDEA